MNTENTDWKDELDKESKKQFIEHKGYIHISFIIPFIESLLKEQREGCKEAALQIMDMPQYTGSMIARAILKISLKYYEKDTVRTTEV